MMVEQNWNLTDIPTIGNSQIWSSPTQGKKTFEKPDVAMFDNAPSDVTIWSFFGKIIVWLVVWLCAVALLFWSLAAVGWIAGLNSWNSVLRVIFPIIWFVVNFVWSLALALMYNIFFSKRYYNFSKMAGLIFVSSLILLLFSFVFYLMYKNTNDLYIVLWFQILFWLYFSLNLMDYMSQPNYSASSMMWNTLWCILTVIAYLLLMPFVENLIYYSILPVILSYSVMILWASIWDAVYYKLYEWWNNPLYLPSLTELREERQKEEKEKEKDEEEVNVEVG